MKKSSIFVELPDDGADFICKAMVSYRVRPFMSPPCGKKAVIALTPKAWDTIQEVGPEFGEHYPIRALCQIHAEDAAFLLGEDE